MKINSSIFKTVTLGVINSSTYTWARSPALSADYVSVRGYCRHLKRIK